MSSKLLRIEFECWHDPSNAETSEWIRGYYLSSVAWEELITYVVCDTDGNVHTAYEMRVLVDEL